MEQLQGTGPGTCWQSLFPSSVFALGFPIPERVDYCGLQLALGVMLDLAGIMHYVDVQDAGAGGVGIYYKGPRSLLFPTDYDKDSKTVQWHLIWREDSPLAPGILYESEQGKSWVTALGPDELQSSKAILGYCRKTAILLGTKERLESYKQLAASRADQDRPAPEVALSTATISISAAGFATAQLAGGIKYRRGLSVARIEASLKYAHLLDSAETQSVILFDTEEGNERAWLVPQLSVMLDLVNHWASKLDPQPHIQFAETMADGASASKTVLKNPIYANSVFRKSILQDEGDDRVADLVKAIYMQMSLRAELDAASERGARGTKELSRQKLLGWDLLELSQPKMVSNQRKIDIRRTHLDHDLRVTPSWLPLAKQVPVYFGRRLGELIVPVEPARVCDAWFPLPGGFYHNYLAASVTCLSQISKAHGFEDFRLLSVDLAWNYGYNKNWPFQDCKEQKHDCAKAPQQLVKSTDMKIRPTKLKPSSTLSEIPDEGAVVFSNKKTWSLKMLECKEVYYSGFV